MRFEVERFAHAGSVEDDGLSPSSTRVDTTVEAGAAPWEAVPATAAPAEVVVFLDGVRRVDARAFVRGADGDRSLTPALFGSVLAGAVRCDGRAQVIDRRPDRLVVTGSDDRADVVTRFGTYRGTAPRDAGVLDPDQLVQEIQSTMIDAEVRLAQEVGGAGDLLVVDGPRRTTALDDEVVGMVKSHATRYLPAAEDALVGRLGDGERTPLFRLAGASKDVLSWYLRLPGGVGHPWAGVVRCELGVGLDLAAAVALADVVSATLPRFASQRHRDPRAPQNLVPIGGLERRLRHLLGDPELLLRALAEAGR